MPSIDPPESVPVCTDADELSAERRTAKEQQRPLVAVVDVEGTPGWQATYSMEETGHGRDQVYLLDEAAVAELERLHREFRGYVDQYSFNDGCSHTSGSLHGLNEADAKELAALFADVVWDVANWEPHNATEAFLH